MLAQVQEISDKGKDNNFNLKVKAFDSVCQTSSLNGSNFYSETSSPS